MLQEEKWEKIKQELKAANRSLWDFGLSLSFEEEEADFRTYLSNNELELAWELLRDKFLGHSPFLKQMMRAANLMQLSDPFGTKEI